jgi:hypothetical protein
VKSDDLQLLTTMALVRDQLEAKGLNDGEFTRSSRNIQTLNEGRSGLKLTVLGGTLFPVWGTFGVAGTIAGDRESPRSCKGNPCQVPGKSGGFKNGSALATFF